LLIEKMHILFGDLSQDEKIIEKLKNRHKLRELNDILRSIFPEIYKRLISERDEVLFQNIIRASEKTAQCMKSQENQPPLCVVCVIGMGHMDGLRARLEKHSLSKLLN